MASVPSNFDEIRDLRYKIMKANPSTFGGKSRAIQDRSWNEFGLQPKEIETKHAKQRKKVRHCGVKKFAPGTNKTLVTTYILTATPSTVEISRFKGKSGDYLCLNSKINFITAIMIHESPASIPQQIILYPMKSRVIKVNRPTQILRGPEVKRGDKHRWTLTEIMSSDIFDNLTMIKPGKLRIRGYLVVTQGSYSIRIMNDLAGDIRLSLEDDGAEPRTIVVKSERKEYCEVKGSNITINGREHKLPFDLQYTRWD